MGDPRNPNEKHPGQSDRSMAGHAYASGGSGRDGRSALSDGLEKTDERLDSRAGSHEITKEMDPAKLVHRLVECGTIWADLDAAASVLEETKGSVLGQMVTGFIGQGKSATAAEHMAKASSMYHQHVARMVEARRLANRAKVNYEAGKTYIDLTRTMESSRRAEMKLGGSVT